MEEVSALVWNFVGEELSCPISRPRFGDSDTDSSGFESRADSSSGSSSSASVDSQGFEKHAHDMFDSDEEESSKSSSSSGGDSAGKKKNKAVSFKVRGEKASGKDEEKKKKKGGKAAQKNREHVTVGGEEKMKNSLRDPENLLRKLPQPDWIFLTAGDREATQQLRADQAREGAVGHAHGGQGPLPTFSLKHRFAQIHSEAAASGFGGALKSAGPGALSSRVAGPLQRKGSSVETLTSNETELAAMTQELVGGRGGGPAHQQHGGGAGGKGQIG